jgi:hypothetical protein
MKYTLNEFDDHAEEIFEPDRLTAMRATQSSQLFSPAPTPGRF